MKNQLNFKIILAIVIMGLSACKKDKENDAPTPVVNKKPTVSAGADVEITLPVSTIVLKGTATDEDGTIQSRLWTQKSGASIALLTNPSVDEVTASTLKAGEYIFEFQATDDKGTVSKDEVKVTVKPALPDNPDAVRLKQISYSQTDFISFEYNTAGKLSRYISQYQNSQGNPNSISQFVYDLKYDEAGKLIELTEIGLFKTTYIYTNGVLSKTEKRKMNGELFESRTYTFEQGRLKEEINETRDQNNAQILIRTQFEYNATGNLTKKTFASKGIHEANFVIIDTFTYSDFDTKKKADDFRMMLPILPEVVFQTNNPRMVEHRAADGTLIKSESYSFQYRENGLPSSITKQNLQVPNAKLEGTLIYE